MIMFPSVHLFFHLLLLLLLSIDTTKSTLHSVVIEVKGDCQIFAQQIARTYGYRYVRQIFDGFCELEEDPTSENHSRHRRAMAEGIDPAEILREDEQVTWAESQVAKIRTKRDARFNDPEWNNMWYLMRHSEKPTLPDLNVTGAWEMGYTGRGRVVTFLDDGLEYEHPDLKENYDKEASTDINGGDDDPTPRYDPTNENKHGTRCAGEVSAKENNGICGVGIAYHARVGGIRMLDGDVTDSVEARSISHRPDHVEIYSASWGPDDNGLVVDGPGPLARRAFENGALNGRDKKGSIFVWASGNGGRSSDSCACDGYINSIYTIAVSSVAESGNKPWYLEECAGVLTSAYSSGQGGNSDHDIITTDLHHGCTQYHTGTSAAAPLAAAVYALVLEANPDLTWRDVMYITVLGSRAHAIPSNTDMFRNAAGYNVSSRYGFGLMDAGLMTWYAKNWNNIPSMSTCEYFNDSVRKTIGSHSNESFTVDLSECQNSNDPQRQVNYIEQVQVIVNLTTTNRGEMEIFLYSPSNTRTQILPLRSADHSADGFNNWAFLTVHLWGENPHGQWRLQVVNTGGGSAMLVSWRLRVHGTRDYPISLRSISENDSSNCHVECNPAEPCGDTDTNCTSCRHFKLPLSDGKFRCVGICPEGTYASNAEKLCLPCHSKCGSCRNASEYSCVSCKSDLFLIHDTMICTQSCPEKYYTDRTLRKCIRCKTDCASCDSNSYICTSCPVGYAIKDNDCVKAAEECDPNEYYDFVENRCRWCDSRCATCSGPRPFQCTSCDQTKKYPYLQYQTCVAACSPGFYLSPILFQCLSCHDTCLNCTSSNETSCFSCKLGYVHIPDTHRCEKYTGKPFYIDSNTGEKRTCHSSCMLCRGPKPTDCIACNSMTEVLLDDGHCVNECPKGSFMTVNKTNGFDINVCFSCPAGCLRCINTNQCAECDQSKGYNLINHSCIPTCPLGSYLLGTRCETCQSPCETCRNFTNCLKCQGQLNLHNDQCVEKCPDGFYSNDHTCLQCSPMCSTCTGPSEDDCQSCADGFRFDAKDKSCSSLCPNGNFYSKDKICELCTDNCLECLHPGSYCRQCSYPLSLDTSTHRCLTCCTTNITTNDCCQCPLIWDGFCRHPLAVQTSTWWFQSPINTLRTKFTKLDRSRQTAIIVILILISILILIGLIMMTIRHVRSLRLPRQYRATEYLKLENLDEDEMISNEHRYDDETTTTTPFIPLERS